MPASDEELMRRIKAGDHKAFAELYDRWAPRLYAFILSRGHSRIVADDVLQDIFMKLAEKPQLFDINRRFSSWIFTVTLNKLRNLNRDAYAHTAVLKALHTPSSATDAGKTADALHHNIDRKVIKKALYEHLNHLEPHHREVVLMRYHDNLSLQEIAEILNIPEGTVKSRLFYALRLLAEKLKGFNPM